MNKIDYKREIQPAIWEVKGEKLWRNPCEICNKKFEEGERVVEVFKSAFKGSMSYKRFCYKCFMKALLMNFYEGLNDNQIKEEVVKELAMNKIK